MTWATAMMAAGGLVAVISAVAGNVVLVRRLGREGGTALDLVARLLAFAAAGSCGLGLLVGGGVLGYSVPAWWLIWPLLLFLLSVGAAWFVRRLGRQIPS